MKTETRLQLITVCDKCSELLTHKILNPAMTAKGLVEIRVESCPDCLSKAKKIVKDLLDCPDLNLDDLDEVSIERIEKAREWLSRSKE